jgi:hypothetical protein
MMKSQIPRWKPSNAAPAAGAVIAAIAAMLCATTLLFAQERPSRGRTVVGIRGSMFTINGELTYTPASGFPNANSNLIGTLLNVRAVQAVFDDANYPKQGSRDNPYPTFVMGPVSWDYPDGKWDPERNVREFIEALPEWRKAGLLAFTVNFQGGGPTDGNYGPVGDRGDLNQPQSNSGFDAEGNLKPAYASRMERIISAADRLGMVVIVGFFYFGQDAKVTVSPDGKYVREAVSNGMKFLRGLPYRNVLVEINNEISPGYRHPQLRPDGIGELITLARQVGGGEIPISTSWISYVPQPGSSGHQALMMADFIMIHTNGRLPEEVHTSIQQWRRLGGYDHPMLINEDGFSTFNLHAAVQEHVGWGYYDQGWSNYRDGFQSPPTNWRINTPLKWLFFEQVARLSGSPVPPMPEYSSAETPVFKMIGLAPNQVVRGPIWVEAIVEDRHSRWPIQRVEFFIDDKPYSYRETAPYMLGGERWNSSLLSPGKHTLRVVAIDRRGPRFTQTGSILEIPFIVEK